MFTMEWTPSSTPTDHICTKAEVPVASCLSVDRLNDDYLHQLFPYLNLAEQTRFALVSSRLCNIFQYYFQRNHIVLHEFILNQMEIEDIHYLFTMVGDSIKVLTALPSEPVCNTFVSLVHYYCDNVRSIRLLWRAINEERLGQLLANMNYLTHLSLVDCGLRDNSMLLVTKLPHLKTLNVSLNENITGKYLWKLTNLIELNLYKCGIVDKTLTKICVSLKRLKNLDITDCNRLEFGLTHIIVHYAAQLEALVLTYTGGMSLYYVACLQNLRLLSWTQIDCRAADCVQFLGCLAKLEAISLHEYIDLYDEELLQLVRNGLKLKYINVIACKNITDKFVYNVIDVLSEQLKTKQRAPMSEPMLFMVSGTDISDTILTVPKYLAAASILRLNFLSYEVYLSYRDYYRKYETYGDFKHFFLKSTTFDYEKKYL